MKRLAAALAALAACTGGDGTVDVALTTAPGSTVLAAATTLRVTITNPRSVTSAARGSDGSFALAVEFDSIGSDGAIVVEALDGSGATVAVGETPPFPLSAVNADVVVYMAAPRSLAAAPLAMDAARSGLAVAPEDYGAVIAGGADATGAPTTELHVYNAFDHSYTAGLALPVALAGMASATGTSALVYYFGGTDASGSASGALERFDATVAPDGSYTDLGAQAQYARTGAAILQTGIETFVVSGAPALDLDGEASTLTARTDLASAPATAASVVGTDTQQTVIFAGSASGCVRLRADTVDTLAIPGAARAQHAVVALAAGRVAILGGELGGAPTTDAVLIDATAGTATTVAGALSTPRLQPAVAATARYVVVAGGLDATGAILATADILDGTTLALVTTVPMVVGRAGASAIALPNEQVLIVGGTDASGAPASDLIELFTPDAP